MDIPPPGLRSHLEGNGVRLTVSRAPVALAHGHQGELGGDDGAADGGGNLLRALDAEAEVALAVADGNESLRGGA